MYASIALVVLAVLTARCVIYLARRNDKLSRMTVEQLHEESYFAACEGRFNNIYDRELKAREASQMKASAA